MNKRHEELILKLFRMGEALAKEGESKGDTTILSAGKLIVFISGLLADEEDLRFIGRIASMFSAQKLIEIQTEFNEETGLDENLYDFLERIKNDGVTGLGDDEDLFMKDYEDSPDDEDDD